MCWSGNDCIKRVFKHTGCQTHQLCLPTQTVPQIILYKINLAYKHYDPVTGRKSQYKNVLIIFQMSLLLLLYKQNMNEYN